MTKDSVVSLLPIKIDILQNYEAAGLSYIPKVATTYPESNTNRPPLNFENSQAKVQEDIRFFQSTVTGKVTYVCL